MLATQIYSERLRLRPFAMADAEALFAYSADPEWRRYQRLPEPYDQAAADRFLAELVLQDRCVQPSWAIVVEGDVVGIVNLSLEQDGRVAALGYGVHRKLWGKGFANEA